MNNLTELPYDTSWASASDGWPELIGDDAYSMYVFANCAPSIPHGTYVLMSRAGHYKDTITKLRVHPNHIEQLKADFLAAGSPLPDESVKRRGDLKEAPRWWV